LSRQVDELERQLDSFDPPERRRALHELMDLVEAGKLEFPETGLWTNLHFHTFYSYNSRGYSPSKVAWLARRAGLAAAGVIDFDVLDALDEFYEASDLVGLESSVGIETRVFVPEFADAVINSPGEPGIAYHMGSGMPRAQAPVAFADFSGRLRRMPAERNKGLVERVNRFLDPVKVDYETDVIPLTPAGNATERHICVAYARKARSAFPSDVELERFWQGKLGGKAHLSDMPEGRNLLNLLRALTMKRAGIGYVEPDAGSFPTMAEVNEFTLAAGGIPTLAWLDGTSDGEAQIDKLLDVAMATGVAAVNIIPDRNYTPGLGRQDRKCRNLYEFVELACRLDLPVVVGTEMNSPGQKFVDDFDTEELAPLVPVFLRGAHIVCAHSAIQRSCGLGYLSEWARDNFESVPEKNRFFETLGRALEPRHQGLLKGLKGDVTPDGVLEIVLDAQASA